MRTRSFLPLLVIALGSCAADPDPIYSPTLLLTQKPWVFFESEARMSDGDPWQPLPFTRPDRLVNISHSPCTSDDTYTYYLDGRMIIDDGATKCTGTYPRLMTGNWMLIDSQTKIRINYADYRTYDLSISTLNSDTLKLVGVVAEIQVQNTFVH